MEANEARASKRGRDGRPDRGNEGGRGGFTAHFTFYLRSFSDAHALLYSRPGRASEHHIMCERGGRGTTLVVGRSCLVNDPKTTLLRFGSITTLDAFDEGELLLPKINLNLI